MRLLLLLLAPLMGFAQLDTTLTYKTKHVHTVVIKPDSSTLSWKADTIKYQVPFEIKITHPTSIQLNNNGMVIGEAGGTVIIDGYGTYKIAKREIHGQIDSLPGWPYYELSNGSHLTFIANSVIWEFPIVNRKTKTIIFEID